MFKTLRASYPQHVGIARYLRVLGLAGLVCLLDMLGVLGPLDDFFYDHFSSLHLAPPPPGSEVLLLEIEDEILESGTGVYRQVVRQLRELGARKVLFTFTPRHLKAADLASISSEVPVIWGLRLRIDRYDPNVRELEAPIDSVPGSDLRCGVVHVDLPRRGIHRTQTAWHFLDEGRLPAGVESYPAIEILALSGDRRESLRDGPSHYLVDFTAAVEGLPTITARQLLDGEILRDLVEGRVVIAGSQRVDGEPRLAIPRRRGAVLVSPLEFHGYALQTLLDDAARRTVRPAFRIAALLIVALAGSALLLRCEAIVVLWVSSLLVVITLCASYVAFSLLYLWFPVGALLVLELSLGLLSLHHKSSLAGSLTRQVLMESQPDETEPTSGSTGQSEAGCWPVVIGLINQTLQLNRCLFLENKSGTDNLKNAISLNCTFNDIGERRRNASRPPYITALEAGGPIRVEGYLRRALGREQQFIAPLEHAGELLGFWVLGVEESRFASLGAFERLVVEYSAIIAQLVYQHRVQKKEQSFVRRLERMLGQDQTRFVYRHLRESVGNLKSKLSSSDKVINKIQTGTAIFNLFGEPVSMNRRMRSLLISERLKPRRLTALDFLAALTEYDADKAKKVLRHILLNQQILTMPVKLSSDWSGNYLMHLQPLQLGGTDEEGDEAKDLTARGLLCEVVDARSFTAIYEMKENLARRLGMHLRNELASVDLSSSLISKCGLTEEQNVHAALLTQEKVARSMELIVECQQYFNTDRELETLERFPLDSLGAFREAMKQVRPLLVQKGVRVTVEKPKLMSFSLASRENLSVVFTTMLKLLIGDAADSTEIRVEVCETEDLIIYAMRNSGFGIPNERFQEFLFSEKSHATGNLKMLRDCLHWVESWGGELEAESEVGVGTSARLGLVKFM